MSFKCQRISLIGFSHTFRQFQIRNDCIGRAPVTSIVTSQAAEPPAPDDRYWGSYRPGVYLGLKTRHPRSPVTGLMWFTPAMFQGGELPLRSAAAQPGGGGRTAFIHIHQ